MGLKGRLVELIFCSGSFWAEQDTAVVLVAQVTASGQAKRQSLEFVKKVRLVFSKSTVKKHRISSLSCFRIHRLMAWMVASQPFVVPNPGCVGRSQRFMSSDMVAGKAFVVRRRRVSPTATCRWSPSFSRLWRSIHNPRDNWTRASCRSDGFPRTRKTKSSCAFDGGRAPVSVGAFFVFLLSSSSVTQISA